VEFLDDLPGPPPSAADVLLVHDVDYSHVAWAPGSVIVDPWGRYTTDDPEITVVHYGNTRSRDVSEGRLADRVPAGEG
jgi:hypothetical protein